MGLWKPLDHEKSAKKDKVFAPPYLENFASPAIQHPPGPLSDLGMRLGTNSIKFTPHHFNLQIRASKDRMKRELRRITNKFPIRIALNNDFVFAFKWNKVQFAAANGLDPKAADRLFEKVKTEAIGLRAMVLTRIDRIPITDAESGREFSFRIADITDLLKFANGFKIEDEFFRNAAENQA